MDRTNIEMIGPPGRIQVRATDVQRYLHQSYRFADDSEKQRYEFWTAEQKRAAAKAEKLVTVSAPVAAPKTTSLHDDDDFS